MDLEKTHKNGQPLVNMEIDEDEEEKEEEEEEED